MYIYIYNFLSTGNEHNTVSIWFLSDIDECSVSNGGCQHKCINTPGSSVCKCDDGYYLDADKKSCQGKNALTKG